MKRVLEPEVMDTEEDVAEYSGMDHHGVNSLFVDTLIDELGLRSGRVLDIGTGPADIPLMLAERLPAVTITGIDLAAGMVDWAARRVAKSAFADRVEIRRADAKAAPFPDGAFDFVISNSIIHHIPDPTEVLREVRRLARPGAGVLLKDLRRPKTAAAARRLVGLYAAGDTDYQRKLFYDSLRAALTRSEVLAMAKAAGLSGLEFSEPGDRHWQLARAMRRSGT